MSKDDNSLPLDQIAEIVTGKSNVVDATLDGLYPLFDRSQQVKKSKRYLYDTEAVIVPGEGKEFIPRYYKGKFDLHQRAYALIPNEKVDGRFLYYSVMHNRDHFSRVAVGSTVKSLRLDSFKSLSIHLPPLEKQKSIANVLTTFDDKIELNRQTNATLEAIAQAIFKEWFVYFNYPGATGELVESELGFIPKGWRVEKIGKILKTKLGGTPSTKKKEYWENGIIPWINSGKVNEFRIIEPSTYITKEAVRKSNTKLLPKRTVVIAITGATLGQVSLLEIDSCANQSVIGILENESIPSEYIYLWVVSNIQSIISNQSGGAQQHINTNDVNNSLIVVPDYQVLTNFHQLISPVFDRESLLCFESASLAKIRDLLLPRLMNGEIEV